jgi:hypothetical protein
MPSVSSVTRGRRFRQRGGGYATESCPPGVFCLSTTTLIIILLAAILVAGGFIYMALQNQSRERDPVNIKLAMDMPQAQRVQVASSGLPQPPERVYQTGPDFSTAGAVFNFPTQGYAESYQQVGLLVAPGGSALAGNSERTLVPLYGRHVTSNRNRWNYYMRTDGLNPVQVPIRFKNRDCDDDNGCDEIYSGDEVSVPAQGQTYKANIYRQKSIAYNPFG